MLLGSNITEVKLVQLSNAYPPILVTELGIVIVTKLDHLNANEPILVTELGIFIVKLVQLWNTLSPILVTLYVFVPFVTVAGISIATGVPINPETLTLEVSVIIV